MDSDAVRLAHPTDFAYCQGGATRATSPRLRGEVDARSASGEGGLPTGVALSRDPSGAYEAVGFTAEGVARGSSFFYGVHRDELVMAVLRVGGAGSALTLQVRR
jgi:hypothetical protein